MSARADREFRFSDRDFRFLQQVVKEQTGINLTEAKRELVYGRLARRLRALGMPSFDAYCKLLRDDPGDEMGHAVNAITTNLTAFFRERHHFDFIARELVPALKAPGRSRRVRFWSAGCSTGEEPYSLAMTLRESGLMEGGHDVKILATDLDTNCVDTAKAGRYAPWRLEGMSRGQRDRWFDGEGGDYRAVPDLREMITFKPLNLLGEWPMKGPFQAIFCRNVMIYFDRETQRELVDRYADLLEDGGYLFIGHSESLFRISDRFDLVGNTIYRKR